MGSELLYLWQLPQNVLGLAVVILSRARAAEGFASVYVTEANFGVSLGNYIIVNKDALCEQGLATIRHELGHRRQSRYLGWLYLPLIGLPSISGNIWDRLAHRSWSSRRRVRWYYGLPWERWADRLGGTAH